MSNIHGFHNIGPRAQQQPAARGPNAYQRQPEVQSGYETDGISFMAPPPRPDGLQPELSERIFPWIGWRRVTTAVCIIDVLMFIITLIVGGAKYDGAFVKGNDMGGPSALTLCEMGGKWEPAIRAGAIWRFFSPILLHAGILHLTFNLFFQMRFGYVLEVRWGWGRWLGVYILSGLMASLWSTQISPDTVSVGASGALFGLVGADITYLVFNWSHIPHNHTEMCFLVFLTVINMLLSLGSGIDMAAHGGGLVGGLFLGIAIPPHLAKREKEHFWRSGCWFIFAAFTLMFVLLIYVGREKTTDSLGCW